MKKEAFSHGDLIEITTFEGIKKGTYMPSSEKFLTLKLESGYNIGISKKKIKSIKLISKYKKPKENLCNVSKKKNLKTITILHTGGTIASEVDYNTGAVTAKFTPEELICMFPELSNIANIESKLIRNMFSEDIRFAHYNILAKEIEKASKNSDGIIITHGTDTIGYTAAALSFILENLNIPVILVGAQRSSDRPSTDAAINLICASQFIAKSNFAEVAVCMHENMSDESCLILPGTRTRKCHSSRRDGFKAINSSPIAQVKTDGTINYINSSFSKTSNLNLKLKLIKENLKIGWIKSHPNMYSKELEVYKSFDGLLIEGTGLGHFPINSTDKETKEHSKMLNTIKALTKKIPVAMSTQAISGRINMNVYSTGRLLQEAGVIGNYSDMQPETAYIKLAWLLSNHKKEVKKLFTENLRGEISKRSLE
ncbi:MAG: Glu-tRNA(Gln) amidotransferase subunit GatD [Candidatus Nanoarchaeia archaeon]|nr:Glu-tRNA(Gln) amidotransferase subunit GatD [Candidatus Nanoarchaeia archaeon]